MPPPIPISRERRYRDKRKAADQTTPDAIERALLQEVERCGRGELSDQERIALADRLADLAMDLLWRSKRLSQTAVRPEVAKRQKLGLWQFLQAPRLAVGVGVRVC